MPGRYLCCCSFVPHSMNRAGGVIERDEKQDQSRRIGARDLFVNDLLLCKRAPAARPARRPMRRRVARGLRVSRTKRAAQRRNPACSTPVIAARQSAGALAFSHARTSARNCSVLSMLLRGYAATAALLQTAPAEAMHKRNLGAKEAVPMNLKDQAAIVTGGGSGLGAATAAMLAKPTARA